MMLYDKKFYKYIGCCAVYLVFTICYLFFSNATTVWQASWFSDKFFVYQYAIVLLLGYSIISSYYNSQTYNRFETRKRIVTNQLFLYALLNLILVTMLFVLAMAVTMILGGAKSFFTLQTLLDLYFRFLLGSYLLETIDLIFEYSGVKSLSAGAQIISFLLLNFELLLLIPRLHLHTCNSLNLLFSWIFFADIWGYVPLGVLCLLSTVVVYERANRGDLLK